MKRKLIIVLGLAGLLLGFLASRAAETTRRDQIRSFMRQKLVYSQAILEGLTLGAIRMDRVGMCLDIGHANLCASTRNDYLGYLDKLNMRVPIIHLHVHENWGDCDSHLPLFTGPAARDEGAVRGFIERIKRRNYSGSIILEQWPHPPSLLNRAREGLQRLLAEANG